MKTLIRFLLVFAVLVIIAVFVIIFSIYDSKSAQNEVLEEQSFDSEIAEVEIQVNNAPVKILPSNDDTARITLTGNSDDFTLKTDLSGDRLQIEVEDRSRFFNFGFNRSYSLQVHIPANGLVSLTVESDNGAIQAMNIGAAEIKFETDNGRIELDEVDSEIASIDTDNGRVEVSNMHSNISVRSSNGRITFTDVSGELLARANNGRIELTTDILDFPVDFETDNGRIEIFTSNEPADARIEANTDNGRIELYGQDTGQLSFGNGEILIKLESDNGRVVVE